MGGGTTEINRVPSAAEISTLLEAVDYTQVRLEGNSVCLANIITLYAVYCYRTKEVMMIVFCRIVLAAVFSGNMMALAYSFAGSTLCLLGMLLVRKIIDRNHIWIASVLGAILHNICQMMVAIVIMGMGVSVYLPFLLVSGSLAGH